MKPLDPGAVYEVKLVAYNGNGESDCSKRLVSLVEDGTPAKASAGKGSMNACFVCWKRPPVLIFGYSFGDSVLMQINLGFYFAKKRRASATVRTLRAH